jgi:hypothetical protein
VVLLEAPPHSAEAPRFRGDGPLALSAEAIGYERLDPHTVRLRVPGPPGLAVVSEGYHADFQAEAHGERRSLLRANGRYWAVPTAGGGETVTVTYRPRWRPWAVGALAVGILAVVRLILAPGPRVHGV